MLRVGIVAGEASGDILGTDLICAIKKCRPQSQFEGIAGPGMIKAGCRSLFDMERLSVMGLVETLGRLNEALRIRRKLVEYFIQNPPDVFIGIDAPEFNLGLEYKLKQHGIKVVHYVSPSVWAWRRYRIRRIAKSVDLMLTLFPFERDFYSSKNIKNKFVGHPLADIIPLHTDPVKAKATLGLDPNKKVIALLPGSRVGEVSRLAIPFLETVELCQKYRNDLQFITPLVNLTTREIFEDLMRKKCINSIKIVENQSDIVLTSADIVLTASGTATLEAMLYKKPMIVAYKFSSITAWLFKRLVKVKYFSLPNLLIGSKVVAEFFQQDVTSENLYRELIDLIDSLDQQITMKQKFTQVHLSLKQNAGDTAAAAILDLIKV